MTVKIKIPVKKVRHVKDVNDIEMFLRKNPKDAYTAQGIMVELFGVDPKDLDNKTFAHRSGEHNNLYGNVMRALVKLANEGKASRAKDGKAHVFWIADGGGR